MRLFHLPREVTFCTLVVSWAETFRRAKGDPNRHTVEKEWYKNVHHTFRNSLPFLRRASESIETDNLEAIEVATRIADLLPALPDSDSKGGTTNP